MIRRLSLRQQELLREWLPGIEVVRDHSWGLTSTIVLEAVAGARRFVIKASDEADHHLVRELRAHRLWVQPWTSRGLAPRLRFSDEPARILVTDWVPGELVEGGVHERDPEVHHQAGMLLSLLHRQLSVADEGYEARETAKTIAWLDRPHRIARQVEEQVRVVVAGWPRRASVLVPTHGDWQPRNWLVDDGRVRVIDFGRADLRPAYTDWTRLAVQQFVGEPALERAFLEGYGSDPRETGAWQRQLLREAVSTTVWAHQVGDTHFEAQGHRMLDDALDLVRGAPRWDS